MYAGRFRAARYFCLWMESQVRRASISESHSPVEQLASALAQRVGGDGLIT